MTRILALVLTCAAAGLAASSAAADAAPRPLAAKCGDTSGVAADPFWLRASDGTKLYAIEAGSGNAGVVLAHESPSDLCPWLPYARTLVDAGFRVLAFDFRGFGDSARADSLDYRLDLAAAIARIRADGAKRVILIGASFGGAAALAYGPTLDVDGIVSLSGETHLAGRFDGMKVAPRLRVPLLIVGSRHDRYLWIPDALRLLRRAGTEDKRTAFYPGGFHGWDIVEDAPYAARARRLVLEWIRAHAG